MRRVPCPARMSAWLHDWARKLKPKQRKEVRLEATPPQHGATGCQSFSDLDSEATVQAALLHPLQLWQQRRVSRPCSSSNLWPKSPRRICLRRMKILISPSAKMRMRRRWLPPGSGLDAEQRVKQLKTLGHCHCLRFMKAALDLKQCWFCPVDAVKYSLSDSEEDLQDFKKNVPKRRAVISDDDSFIPEPADSDIDSPAPLPKVPEPVWVWQRCHTTLCISPPLFTLYFSAGRKWQKANRLWNQERASRAVSPGHVTMLTNHNHACESWAFSPCDDFQHLRMSRWRLPRLQWKRNLKRLQPKNLQPPKNQQQQRRKLQVISSALRAACCLRFTFERCTNQQTAGLSWTFFYPVV